MPRSGLFSFLVLACLEGCAVQLRPPVLTPLRTIEPQLLEPNPQVESAPTAAPLRLLDTQARGHIGRRLLRQEPNGELTQDPVWQWSSAPDRYLDTALHMEVSSNPRVRLVDASNIPTLGALLLVWNLESKRETQLVGAVEFQFTGMDHVVRTQIIRASEPVSAELPGNLASAAGSLLRRLVAEGLTRMAPQQ